MPDLNRTGYSVLDLITQILFPGFLPREGLWTCKTKLAAGLAFRNPEIRIKNFSFFNVTFFGVRFSAKITRVK